MHAYTYNTCMLVGICSYKHTYVHTYTSRNANANYAAHFLHSKGFHYKASASDRMNFLYIN